VNERQDYVRDLLAAYRSAPGTVGVIRRPDRVLAGQLYSRGVPLSVVLNALVLASARRLIRPFDAPPLPTIRSLAYYAHVIDEVLALDAGDDYFQHLRAKLRRLPPTR